MSSAESSRVVLVTVLSLTLGAGCSVVEEAGDDDARPPIIIVDVDTLGASHLGCYGYARNTSPNIDRFAAESVLFEWTFSQAPNTPPSQSSILTSLYPTVHGRIDDADLLPDSVVTLAEAVAAEGYATAAFVDGGLMAREFGLAQGFDIYDDVAGGVETIGPKAEAWIGDRPSDRFLLLMHTYDVHSPYERTPEPFKSAFLDGLQRPSEDFVRHMTQRMEERRLSQYSDHPQRLDAVQVEYAKALYDGGILHVDRWFGGFLEFLREQQLYDKAIIVLISDHGDAFEEHNTVFHERLYSPVTRVPMVIRFPGASSSGRIADTVETIDLMPTLLSLVGIEAPPEIQGQDLMVLVAETGAYRQLAISESPFFGRRIAVATDEYRLLLTGSTGAAELYAFRNDPVEQHDLAAELPEIVERLRGSAERWEALVHSRHRRTAAVVEMKDETIEQLKTLGYLE